MLTTLFGAALLALAAPTAGQTAPTKPPANHAGHADHKGMDHHQHGTGSHDCKACCEEARKTGAKMPCGMDAERNEPAAGEHAQHDH